MIPASIGTTAFTEAIYRRAPDKPLEEMSDVELDAEFTVSAERLHTARWGGRVLGFGGGAFAGLKLVALAGKAALAVAPAAVVV